MSATWIGHPGPTGRNSSWTSPQLPGVVILHCGHPTALYPYYINGHLEELGTFAKLSQAKAAALKLAPPAPEVLTLSA